MHHRVIRIDLRSKVWQTVPHILFLNNNRSNGMGDDIFIPKVKQSRYRPVVAQRVPES